jgi:hypothetical protein
MSLQRILEAIVEDDRRAVERLLKADDRLPTCLVDRAKLYQAKIFHCMYVGDTALHLAAAGYRMEIARTLLAAGADPNAASNHRRSTPLHYAADGFITGPVWNADRQVETIRVLLKSGARLGLADKNGATALHRAVRTRCAAAVRFLLETGADPKARNNPGSTPFHLAVQNTGRGGSGTQMAIAAQREIIRMFLALGLSPNMKTSCGKTVRDSARSAWIQRLLESGAG